MQSFLHSLHGAPTLCMWVKGFRCCHFAVHSFQRLSVVLLTEVFLHLKYNLKGDCYEDGSQDCAKQYQEFIQWQSCCISLQVQQSEIKPEVLTKLEKERINLY